MYGYITAHIAEEKIFKCIPLEICMSLWICNVEIDVYICVECWNM